jgi:hypothetical protein
MANGVVAWTEGDPNIGMKLDMWTALEGPTNSGSTSGLPPVNGCVASGVDSSFVYWASMGPNLTLSISRTSQANPTSPPQPVLPGHRGCHDRHRDGWAHTSTWREL